SGVSHRLGARAASLRGVRNMNKLLPAARDLTSEALLSAGHRYGLAALPIERAARQLTAARRVSIDDHLGDTAMVDTRFPSAIRVGPECAEALVSDDLAIFIVAHELTHIANSSGDLRDLTKYVSLEAKSSACVNPTDMQEEDLTCDFIAELVLRRFIGTRPSARSPEERLWLTLAGGNSGDSTHLSDAETFRALIGLDSQLRLLITRWLWGRGTDDNTLADSLLME